MRYLPTIDYHPNDDRMFVKVYVQGTGKVFWTIALVDTGASCIAISGKLSRIAKAAVARSASSPVQTVNGLLRAKDAGLLIKCGPATCRAFVCVFKKWDLMANEALYSMILGWNWCESFGVVIDAKRRTVAVHEWRPRDLVE